MVGYCSTRTTHTQSLETTLQAIMFELGLALVVLWVVLFLTH